MADKPAVVFEPMPSLGDADLRASFAGEAVHANKVFLSKTSGGVRLAFMEVWGEIVSPQFRTAVFLSYPDAVALRDLLNVQLDDVAKEIARVQSANEAETHGQ